MWRSRRFILGAVLSVIVVGSAIGGIALAQTDGEDGSQLESLMARVAEKVGVDQAVLEQAFAEAQAEMRDDEVATRLQDLVGQGKLTQDEADEYLEWLQARPEAPSALGGYGSGGFGSHRGGFRGMEGMRGFGSHRGGMRGFGWPGAPAE